MKRKPMKKASPPKVMKEPAVRVHKLDSRNPELKYIGGSNFDAWNNTLANQALSSGWYGNNPDPERTHRFESCNIELGYRK
jgi:hypothetical protein